MDDQLQDGEREGTGVERSDVVPRRTARGRLGHVSRKNRVARAGVMIMIVAVLQFLFGVGMGMKAATEGNDGLRAIAEYDDIAMS